jgi:hypothetical protein
MGKRYIAIVVLAGLLAACGAKADNQTPPSDQGLLDLVSIPSSWVVEGIGELEENDIPADAHTSLQESFRAIISEPNQPESSTASAYLVVLLYEDATAARNAYMQVRTHLLVQGAEIGETQGSLPNEEITFAMTNHDATANQAAGSFLQTTVLSCRAVVRFNWDIYHSATPTFTMDDAINVEMESAREIRRATCGEE